MCELFLKFSFVAFFIAFQSVCEKPIKRESANSKAENRTQINNTTQDKKKMEEINENKISPRLEASFNLQDKTLQIEYKVKNTGSKAIYLFNVLWEWDAKGNYIPAPQAAYVALSEDKTLHVAKQIPPLPKIKSVEVRRIPFVTKVEAGQEFAEKFELPVPIEEYNPYFPQNQDTKTEIKTSEIAIFTIQFIRDIDGLKITPTKINNAFSLWHPNIFGNLEALSTNPKPISVQVNKRIDNFEEF